MARRSAIQAALLGYGLVIGLTLLTLVLVLIHQGQILNIGFPFVATIVAAVLFNSRRSVYVAFVWWIWLFTPLVRRLVDYQTVYHNVSPVMLTPLLVTGFALLAVVRRPRVLLRRSMLPFLFVGMVILYATIIGALINGPLAALYDAADWLVPLSFGLFLMMYPAEDAELRASLMFAIILGLLAISLYGIYQFYQLPPWDAYWLNASKFSSAGAAFAEQIRLFGTLNSPSPYGDILMSSLIVVLVAKGRLRILAGGFGFPAFGLSLVRAAWGGWVVAALFVAWRVGGKTRLRIVAVCAILAVIAVPLATAGPVADALAKRFATFSDIRQDQSFKARAALYEGFTVNAISQPIGVGFGGIGNSAKLVAGQAVDFDSGLLQLPYQFGWAGSALFLWAIGEMVLQMLKAVDRTSDRIVLAGGALFIAMLLQTVFASPFSSVAGMAMWTGLALALGPVRAYRPVTMREFREPILLSGP